MTTMIAQARQIFEALAADQPEPAGQRMTAMDQSYARVNTALGELGRDVRAIQKEKFKQQTDLAGHFQKFESAIAILIVLMVTSVAVYGHRLAKQVKETAAELARHRDHLETLVAERTAELEASHQQLRLSERLASIGTLAAGLGHDMNNVLFPVRCRLDSLGSMELAPAMRAELGAVRQAVDYLQQLCDGLRLLALNPDDPGATAGNTDLASWWHDVEPLLRTALPRQVELKSDWPVRLPRVSVPPHRLTQAVFNLVINAGEAIAERGTVWVSGSAHDDGRFVRVAVRDDGRGMGPEERRRALDPFFTTKKRGLSTGLGLSLVHGVARAASGLVEIESKPGSGTTVTMVLPAAEDTAAPGEAEKAEQFLVSITLRDRRIATFVAALLRAQGVMVKFEE